jgi:putative endonuclease
VTRTARQQLGAAGERLARNHLERLGYQFIAANWRCPQGELDLVMRDGETVAFVEVKIRRGERLGRAEDSISAAQARRLLLAAQLYLNDRPDLGDCFWRVDLFAITLTTSGTVSRVTHVPDAIRSS